jgi:hypothetical protein
MLKGTKAQARCGFDQGSLSSTGARRKVAAKLGGKTLRWRRSAREEGSDGYPSGASALEDPKIRALANG